MSPSRPRLVPPPVSLARRAARLALVLPPAAALFLAGRWSAPAETWTAPASTPPRGAMVGPGGAPAATAAPSAPVPGGPPADPEARPAAARQAAVLATQAARARLEAERPALVARCWPGASAGGGPAAAEAARLTFHLTFDPGGREVARAISGGPGAIDGALLRCLRALPVGTLAVPAPGARVGVRVAMRFP